MYRKFTADHIFNGYEILSGPVVLITDQSGTIADITDARDAGDGIEKLSGLLTPGFINAHCHLELSHLKGQIPENTGLVDFVQRVMRNRPADTAIKLDAMEKAEAGMYQQGIVAVGDICNTVDSIPIKQQSRLLWHNFIEVSGFTDAAAVARLTDMKSVLEKFPATPEKRAVLTPHAPYSVSKHLFQLLNTETAEQLITIHNQEAVAENELYRQKKGDFLRLYENFGIDISAFKPTGKTSLQSWLPYFTGRQSIISVHNTFISRADLDFIKSLPDHAADRFFYCLCVNANQYIERCFPPIGLLREKNCNIVIGTDSYASNHELSIWEEIKTIRQETAYSISLQEILKWATVNGAKALQVQDRMGSFEKGKKPGIVLIKGLENLQAVPQSYAERIL